MAGLPHRLSQTAKGACSWESAKLSNDQNIPTDMRSWYTALQCSHLLDWNDSRQRAYCAWHEIKVRLICISFFRVQNENIYMLHVERHGPNTKTSGLYEHFSYWTKLYLPFLYLIFKKRPLSTHTFKDHLKGITTTPAIMVNPTWILYIRSICSVKKSVFRTRCTTLSVILSV